MLRLSTFVNAYRLRGVVRRPLVASFAHDYGRSPAEVRVDLRSGGTLSLRRNTQDISIFREVFAADVYGLRSESGRLENVIDVGANVGMFTAAIAGRAGRVISVEPIPGNVTQFRKNTAHLQNVTLFEGALTESPGPIDIFARRERDSGRFSRYGQSGDASLRFSVQGETLARLCEMHDVDRIDLLKIDIEGGEYDLAAAEQDRALRRAQRVVGEYHQVDGRTRDDLGRSLERAGLRVAFIEAKKRPGQGTFRAVRAA